MPDRPAAARKTAKGIIFLRASPVPDWPGTGLLAPARKTAKGITFLWRRWESGGGTVLITR